MTYSDPTSGSTTFDADKDAADFKIKSLSGDGEYVLAGFFRRAFAYLADILLMLLIMSLILPVAERLNSAAYRAAGHEGVVIYFEIISFFFINIFYVAYFTWFHKLGGQTPGKRLFGIKVVTQDGKETGMARSFFRSVGYYVSMLLLGAGFFWALFDPYRQTWHDKLAGTLVVLDPGSR